MKLQHKSKVKASSETFEPVIELTFQVAIEPIRDAVRLLGEDEMALAIGREFLKALK